MIPKFTQEEYENTKSNDYLKLECEYCGKIFLQNKKHITRTLLKKISKKSSGAKTNYEFANKFCSTKCRFKSQIKRITIKCHQCNKEFERTPYNIKRSKINFCSSSCAATYNNLHKTHGNRRSKFEIYLENKLTLLYPTLEIHFNSKQAVNSELDIYIPSLKLAIEINGIYHYQPIHGIETFKKIQLNDQKKKLLCEENKIELISIDTSNIKRHMEENYIPYLNKIAQLINIRLAN